MPRVYIPNKTPHDFTKAEDYGDLVFIFGEERLNVYQPSTMLLRVREALAGSKPTDRIIVSGLPIVLSILTAEFALQHGRVNFLIFNGGKGVYEPREVYFPDC